LLTIDATHREQSRMYTKPIITKQLTITRALFRPVKTLVLEKNLRSKRHKFSVGRIGL
jgi:hypothetical protein